MPFRDFDRFAQETVKLLTSDKQRIELGVKGRKLAEDYSWDKIANKELNILKGVVGL